MLFYLFIRLLWTGNFLRAPESQGPILSCVVLIRIEPIREAQAIVSLTFVIFGRQDTYVVV